MTAILQPNTPSYTAEDLERLSAQGCRYELIRGELIEMSPTSFLHGVATAHLATCARMLIDEQERGECTAAGTGFWVTQNPDTVMAPDWAFIAKERLPDEWPETGYSPVVPDIVLETRSPGDTQREVALKVALWIQAGVRLVWELDPRARVLTVHLPDAAPRVLGMEDTLTGEDVLPNFTLPLKRVFPQARSETKQGRE